MSEVRLIDANALEKALDYARTHRGGVRETVRAAPTIDAVAVVRCKDCRKRGGKHCPFFEDSDETMHDWTEPNGYCSLAERRQG